MSLFRFGSCIHALRGRNQQGGFSLLEVLITAAIIGIVTVIVVLRYGSFNSAVILKNQAFEIALDIREAQTFAVSVSQQGGDFREEYGLYFSLNNPNSYLLFQDDDTVALPGYDAIGADEQIGEPLRIDSRFRLNDICINNDAVCGVERLDVSFRRPNFDAILRADPDTTDTSPPTQAQSARLEIANSIDSSSVVSVIISSSGQISVK